MSLEEAPTKADFLTLFQTLVLTRPPRDPVNPAPPPVQKGPSRSNFPLRRSQKNTRVASDVRKHAFGLMKRPIIPHVRDNMSPITSVSLHRIANYADSLEKSDGPRRKDFQLSLDMAALTCDRQKADSDVWNKQAADVFTTSFLKCKLYPCRDAELIKAAFITHIERLKEQFRVYSGQRSGTDVARRALATASMVRRRTRRDRREMTCEAFSNHPYMKKCHELMRRMKASACSGDESDGNGTLVITRLPWRHRRVRRWMAILDLLGLSLRFPDGVHATSGNFPLPRKDPLDVEGADELVEKYHTNIVPGLPGNAYDEDCLSSLPDAKRGLLKMEMDFDFEFPPDLLELALTCIDVTGPKTPPRPRKYTDASRV